VDFPSSKKLPMTVQPSVRDDENGMMEAARPQAVSASLVNPDGVRQGESTSPPYTLFSRESPMPAWLPQQEDSPFEGGWRLSADGRQGDVSSEVRTSPGVRKRAPPPLLRGIF
jgi:hypothetical protein